MAQSRSRIKSGLIDFDKQQMVRWYDPRQLFDTAFRVLVSSIFSTYADRRESFPAAGEVPHYDYSDKNDLWLDYIADLGDGWNPTYYTAYLLAQESLSLNNTATKRGDILIMGATRYTRPPPEKNITTGYGGLTNVH